MSITDNIAAIRTRTGKAKLIAVSKTRNVEEIAEAVAAGQRIFGENRVQEAQGKFPALQATHPDIELHLIGPLQTNKVQAAIDLFDVIQTIDRPAIGEAVAKAMRKSSKTPRLYIEVNIGREPQKAGVAPEAVADFLDLCRGTYGLKIDGLMCIPPQGLDPYPFFKDMRQLADDLKLPNLSMGMSDDFEIAIACGATEIRVGTAIFGKR